VARGRREHHDAVGRVAPRGVAKPLDLGIQRAIDQDRVPGTFRQQRLRHRRVRYQAGLAAPALQPPRHQ
jgi:hypothetical protein